MCGLHKDVCVLSLVANCTYSAAPDMCSPGVHCVYIKLTSTAAGACLNGCVPCLYECMICKCHTLARTFTERAQCIPILAEQFSGQQQCGSKSLAIVSHCRQINNNNKF